MKLLLFILSLSLSVSARYLLITNHSSSFSLYSSDNNISQVDKRKIDVEKNSVEKSSHNDEVKEFERLLEIIEQFERRIALVSGKSMNSASETKIDNSHEGDKEEEEGIIVEFDTTTESPKMESGNRNNNFLDARGEGDKTGNNSTKEMFLNNEDMDLGRALETGFGVLEEFLKILAPVATESPQVESTTEAAKLQGNEEENGKISSEDTSDSTESPRAESVTEVSIFQEDDLDFKPHDTEDERDKTRASSTKERSPKNKNEDMNIGRALETGFGILGEFMKKLGKLSNNLQDPKNANTTSPFQGEEKGITEEKYVNEDVKEVSQALDTAFDTFGEFLKILAPVATKSPQVESTTEAVKLQEDEEESGLDFFAEEKEMTHE